MSPLEFMQRLAALVPRPRLAYWQRLQLREAFGRALKSQEQAALAQGLSTKPAA